MSDVLRDEICPTESESALGGGVQEVCVPVDSGLKRDEESNPTIDFPLNPTQTPLTLTPDNYFSLTRLLPTTLAEQHREREIVALEGISGALTAFSKFIGTSTLQGTVQALAVNGLMQAITSGLTAKDGRKALDANLIKQNSLESAYLIESLISKVVAHSQSKTPLEDGEELMGVKES